MIALTIVFIVLFLIVIKTMDNKKSFAKSGVVIVFISSVGCFVCITLLMGMIFLEAIGVPF